VAVQPTAVANAAPVGDAGNEMESFVFDLKSDADTMGFNDVWQNEDCMETAATGAQVSSQKTDDGDARPKTFVFTAYDMVSDSKNAAAIGFSEDGTIIEIRDLDLLADKILPAYFRHKNVTSFYRQLNSYGFRTTRSSSRDVVHAFSHELFHKDRPEFLASIIRKKCLKRQAARSAAKKEEDSSNILGEMPPTSPVSMSSSSDESLPREFDEIRRKSVREAPTSIEMLREAQVKAAERARELEERNRRLRDENRAILAESEQIFRSMNQLVDVEASLIERLFGKEAFIAFSQQSKPFRMGGEPNLVVKAEHVPQSNEADFEDFQGDAVDEVIFADDELEMLENIFTSDAIVA